MEQKKEDIKINPRELANIEKLYNALQDIHTKQNRVSSIEFLKFFKLFKKSDSNNPINDDELRELTNEFMQRFDLYENIEIYNPSTNKTLLILPRIFIPIKDISEENVAAVQSFQKDGVSDIPKYSAEATKKMLDAIVDSQANSNEEYIKNITKFMSEFKNLNLDFIRAILRMRKVRSENIESDIEDIKNNETSSVDLNNDEDFLWE